MTDAIWDLTYLIDFCVRIVMMGTIIIGIIYWIRGPKCG